MVAGTTEKTNPLGLTAFPFSKSTVLQEVLRIHLDAGVSGPHYVAHPLLGENWPFDVGQKRCQTGFDYMIQ